MNIASKCACLIYNNLVNVFSNLKPPGAKHSELGKYLAYLIPKDTLKAFNDFKNKQQKCMN